MKISSRKLTTCGVADDGSNLGLEFLFAASGQAELKAQPSPQRQRSACLDPAE
jgi:hypothetical protein